MAIGYNLYEEIYLCKFTVANIKRFSQKYLYKKSYKWEAQKWLFEKLKCNQVKLRGLQGISEMTNEASMNDVQEPIKTAPPEVRQIIERVWQAEKGRLDKKSAGHINDDILTIVKEAVQ